MDAQRQELINRAERIRAEISQIFIDAGSWNENLRPPGEAKIDPDPDGELAKSAARIDRMLAQQGNEVRTWRS